MKAKSVQSNRHDFCVSIPANKNRFYKRKKNKQEMPVNKYKNKAASNEPLPEQKQIAYLVIPNHFHEGKFSSLTTTQENLKPAGI